MHAECFGGVCPPSMGKRGELNPHVSWKGERTGVGLDSRKRTRLELENEHADKQKKNCLVIFTRRGYLVLIFSCSEGT